MKTPVNPNFEKKNSNLRIRLVTMLTIFSTMSVLATPPLLRMKILSPGGASDETVLYIQPGASLSFDGNYDAYKLFGPSASAQIWMEYDSTQFSINGITMPLDSAKMPLRVRIGVSGNYTIQGSAENGFDQQANVLLYDKLNGQSLPFVNAMHSFSLGTALNLDRFELRIYRLQVNCITTAAFSMPDTIVKSHQTNFNPVNLSQNATSCFWNFGDGSSSTLGTPSHAYSFAGTYTVTLKAFSSAGCRDSVMKRLVVINPGKKNVTMQNLGNNRLVYSSLPQGINECSVQLINTSNYNVSFRKIGRHSTDSELDLADLPQGLYYVIVSNRTEILHRATVLVK